MRLDAPITDWSTEGRRRFVAENYESVHETLRSAFAVFGKPFGEDRFLEEFGFTTLDDAAEWCVDRFAHGRIDPERLHTRTPALFTHVPFWLAQRVTTRGYKRKLAMLRTGADLARRERDRRTEAGDDEDEKILLVDLGFFRNRVARSLKGLHERTCPDLVGRWLDATTCWRAGWFLEDSPPPLPEESKKKRSLVRHDALFRFLCIHFDHLPNTTAPEELAARIWLFEPCPNEPPYRQSEEEIARRLPPEVPRTYAAVHRLRRNGVAQLIERALDAIEPPPADDHILELQHDLRLRSLKPTTLTTYELDEGRQPELSRRLHALKEEWS